MARRQRLRVTGLPIHIIQRGNNRQACFYAKADYQFYLHHLAELAKRFHCKVHAYVLMTNHVHVLLTPYLGRGPSLLMKLHGQRYVQYINKTYRRSKVNRRQTTVFCNGLSTAAGGSALKGKR